MSERERLIRLMEEYNGNVSRILDLMDETAKREREEKPWPFPHDWAMLDEEAREREVPVEDAPVEEASARRKRGRPRKRNPDDVAIPSEELPSDELPTDELPTEEIPSEELPSDELPTEELPSEELPSEELPSDELPSEELPPHVEIAEVQAILRRIASDEKLGMAKARELIARYGGGAAKVHDMTPEIHSLLYHACQEVIDACV